MNLDSLDDYSDLMEFDEEHMLRMHALALAMEKHEANGSVDPASVQIEPGPPMNGAGDTDQSFHLTGPFQPELFESLEEIIAQPEDTASHNISSQPDMQEERPTLPPRQEPRAATLPAKLGSATDGQTRDRDAGNAHSPPQSLPPYQPQYFSPPYQAAEPQQYYPPPEPQQHYIPPKGQGSYPTPPQPQQRQDSGYFSVYSNYSTSSTPQQRQDSGYASMYSNHSVSSTPQPTYYPAPNTNSPQISSPAPSFVSRHSSIPQSYQQTTVTRKPVPYHPADPNLHQQTPINQGHRSSDSSLYPMTPPPPYYTPPAGMQSAPPPTGKEQGYFNQAPPPQQYIPIANPSQYSAINPLLQQPQKLVDGMNKGWQWARNAASLPMKTHVVSNAFVEPNYGPPPAVPTAWRGS